MIDKGEVVAPLSAKGPSVANSKEAEVLACRRVLEFAVDVGFMELVIKGDNVFVMKSILCTRPNRSRLGYIYIYEDVRCLAVGLRGLSVSCVRRSANSAAHSLGRFACHLDEILYGWKNHHHLPLRHCIWTLILLMNPF